MPEFNIRVFRPDDEAAVIRLWRESGLVVDWNNPHTDIERKCADSPELFFVGEAGRRIVASCMAGYDGHRGWIYFLAVEPGQREKGYAAELVRHTEAELVARGCPKVELMVRKTNCDVIAFYQAVGFALDPVVVLSKRLIEDEAHDYGTAPASD